MCGQHIIYLLLDKGIIIAYIVDSMYIDTTILKRNGKTYTRHLLRTSMRVNGKVQKKTIANLSHCTSDEITAIKLAFKHKKDINSFVSIADLRTKLDKRIGAIWTVHAIAKRLGITKALGNDRQGRLALLQVIARIVDQGSRLSAVRFAKSHAVCEVLGIEKLNEDMLYENLAWLDAHQETIEQKLFHYRYKNKVPTLFLYDVTSSYLEGNCNALADWGYNRDHKKGKKQIVVGLLTGSDGLPVAIRVFRGNTADTQTVSTQIKLLTQRFGVHDVVLVGDRGMLKGPQVKELPDDFRYITAITKPQIQTLLGEGVLQYDLFDSNVCEVAHENIRYILRKNPVRAEQMIHTRQSKLASVQKVATERTQYLADHPKAKIDKAIEKVQAKIKQLKADKWLSARLEGQTIVIDTDDNALSEIALLDGCYVIKSDVSKEGADAQTLHDRYCDLEKVERSFRTLKTTHLEMRPVFVKKAESTKGHAFVVMLALLIQRELEQYWTTLDMTVAEGVDELAAIHMQTITIGSSIVQDIPKPNMIAQQLLSAANITLPSVFPSRTADVDTKKKLQSERKHK